MPQPRGATGDAGGIGPLRTVKRPSGGRALQEGRFGRAGRVASPPVAPATARRRLRLAEGALATSRPPDSSELPGLDQRLLVIEICASDVLSFRQEMHQEICRKSQSPAKAR